jgi:hypothetical protein
MRIVGAEGRLIYWRWLCRRGNISLPRQERIASTDVEVVRYGDFELRRIWRGESSVTK